MAGKAAKADIPQEVGPDTVGPTVDDPTGQGLVTIKMDEDEVGLWWGRVERARQRVKSREDAWDILLNEYLPVVSKSGDAETVKVQAHFRNVHTKLGNLFYRSPEVILMPDDPGPGNNTIPNPTPIQPGMPPNPPLTQADIISIKQAALKKKIGRDGIKLNRLMDELIFDVLCWAGIGCCKVGYRCVMQQMAPQPPQQGQPGAVLGLSGAGQPPPQPEPVPIYEEHYSRRFSPKKALWNDDLKSTRFDEDATWMGMEFFLSPKQATKMLGLTEDEAGKAAKDDRVHVYQEDGDGTRAPSLVRCVEIACKASLFTDTQPHPLALNQLILVEGIKDRPLAWRPHPDQEFDAVGRLTPDSITGFPFKVLTIRDLADSCFPPADSAFTNSEIKQMSTWRRQSIRLRDAAIGKYLYDTSAFGEEEVEQLKNGDIGEFIGVEDGKLANGADKIFAQTSKIQGSVDDQRGFAGMKQDIGETLGIGSNQAGVETDTVRTATESDTVNRAMQSRNDKELGRVVDFFLDIVRHLDQLLMRYMDNYEWVELEGTDAAAKMQMWSGKMTIGKWLYDIAPDSQLRPDNEVDFKLALNYYQMTANDALSNRPYILKRLARMRGFDPAKAVLPPPPPQPPKPDMPKITLSLTAADLGNPAVLDILIKAGVLDPMPPPAEGPGGGPPPTPPQLPPHGGPAVPAKPLSDHFASNSGNRPNQPHVGDHREGQVK